MKYKRMDIVLAAALIFSEVFGGCGSYGTSKETMTAPENQQSREETDGGSGSETSSEQEESNQTQESEWIPFTGLLRTREIIQSNTGDNLSAAGYVCETELGIFYGTEEGILLEQEQGIVRISDRKVSYLNFYEGELYFIAEEDGQIYRFEISIDAAEQDPSELFTEEECSQHISEIGEMPDRRSDSLSASDGENLIVSAKEDDLNFIDILPSGSRAYYLCVTDLGIFYVTGDGVLYLYHADGQTEVIAKNSPGWMHFYGEWLLFSTFDQPGFCLTAVNCLTGERKQLAEESVLFPCVQGDCLYGSCTENESDSRIMELNLQTGEKRILSNQWAGSKVVSEDVLYYVCGNHIIRLPLGEETVGALEGLIGDVNTEADMLAVAGGRVYFRIGSEIWYLEGENAVQISAQQ